MTPELRDAIELAVIVLAGLAAFTWAEWPRSTTPEKDGQIHDR